MIMANDFVSSMIVSLSRMEELLSYHALSFCAKPNRRSKNERWNVHPKYHGNSLELVSKKIKKMIKEAKKDPANTYPDTLKKKVFGKERIVIEKFRMKTMIARR
jgi:hypothetical protein